MFAIICNSGFGLNVNWSDDEKPSRASLLDFPRALKTMSESFVLRIVIPSFGYKLPIERSAHLTLGSLKEISN